MAPLSPQEFREQVRSQSDIVGLIGESVALQARSGGREFVGLCPFHDDHNPSMRVYPDRGTFRCWSCNTGGDCFTFVIEREKVTFPEALEILARRANLNIPRYVSGRSPEQENSRAKLFEVLQWAENQFHQTLLESPAAEVARDYLKQRKISSEMIRTFRLGFHPDNWQWLLDRARGKFSTKLLLEARLIGERDGRAYDNFVNRVMFPIHNERGQAVSFGGRILPGNNDASKYWNGPESIVFHKSRLLFAIDKAREAIRDSEQALIVEGYTDCIACHQFGVKNVVGTLGTALTDSHVTAIKRFTRKVVLVFDGDDAGQDAASKAVERFLAQDVDLRILTLPAKMDPADFLENEGSAAFQELADKAPEAWEFRFRAARNKHGSETIDGRQRILDEMIQVLSCVPEMSTSIREPMLVANLAQRLSVTQSAVLERLKKTRSTQTVPTRKVESRTNEQQPDPAVQQILSGRLTPGDRMECDLLETVIAAPEFIGFVAETTQKVPFRNPILNRILASCLSETETTGELTLSRLMDLMPNQELKSLLVWLDERACAKDLTKRIREDVKAANGCPHLLNSCLNALHERIEQQSQQNVAVKISESTDGRNGIDESTEALLRQAAEFHQKRATRKASV